MQRRSRYNSAEVQSRYRAGSEVQKKCSSSEECRSAGAVADKMLVQSAEQAEVKRWCRCGAEQRAGGAKVQRFSTVDCAGDCAGAKVHQRRCRGR